MPQHNLPGKINFRLAVEKNEQKSLFIWNLILEEALCYAMSFLHFSIEFILPVYEIAYITFAYNYVLNLSSLLDFGSSGTRIMCF